MMRISGIPKPKSPIVCTTPTDLRCRSTETGRCRLVVSVLPPIIPKGGLVVVKPPVPRIDDGGSIKADATGRW
jgi:hypothetical protein